MRSEQAGVVAEERWGGQGADAASLVGTNGWEMLGVGGVGLFEEQCC